MMIAVAAITRFPFPFPIFFVASPGYAPSSSSGGISELENNNIQCCIILFSRLFTVFLPPGTPSQSLSSPSLQYLLRFNSRILRMAKVEFRMVGFLVAHTFLPHFPVLHLLLRQKHFLTLWRPSSTFWKSYPIKMRNTNIASKDMYHLFVSASLLLDILVAVAAIAVVVILGWVRFSARREMANNWFQ